MGAGLDEGEDHRAPRAQVLGLDRRLDSVLPVDLPADVDLEAGVRRVWPVHRPPQVLLNAPRSALAHWGRGTPPPWAHVLLGTCGAQQSTNRKPDVNVHGAYC